MESEIKRPRKPQTSTEIYINSLFEDPKTQEYVYKGAVFTLREVILPYVPGGFIFKLIYDYVLT